MTQTVRIFLSSPGDVAVERAQVRELLLGLARGPFVRGRVNIDVVSWDDPSGGATMDARFTPQQALARTLPTPAQCDLTIVLLWGRMGTPLTETKADGAPYLSGTEWEFDSALVANKPVFVYRRAENVLLNPDDPDFEDKLTQKRRLNAFFEQFKSDDGAVRRAYSTYGSIDDLLGRLRMDVEQYLSERLRGVEDAPRLPSAAPVEHGRTVQFLVRRPFVPVAYRDWVKKQHGGVDLLGLQVKKGRPPSLSSIYVPQTTRDVWSDRLGFDEWTRGNRWGGTTLALNRLATESLYISGAPGTGKSTFCRWVAWLVAEGAIPSLDVPPPDEYVEVLDDGLKLRLPVLLRLREFWEYLPPRVGGSSTVADLEDAIAAWVDRKRPDGIDGALFRAYLAHGSTLLLLDGMDEVPVSVNTTGGKWLPRQQLLSALTDACPAWDRVGNRLLLTSRPYGLSDGQAASTGLRIATLQPLPRPLQSLLAHRWFAVLSADSRAGAETAEELFNNIHSQPWLVELAANPLLLTAMCIVFDEGKRLPQDKHELYERVVATVLYSRYQDPADIDRVKRELGVIAYGMHTGGGAADGRTTPKAEATFHEAEGWLQEYQERKGYTERSETDVFETREALLSHSGLFLGMGEERAGFAHLSFQEFFAAQRTFTVNETRLTDVFLQHGSTPEWRNTLSFLFGRLLATSSEPKKALDLLQERTAAADGSQTGLVLVLADAAQVLIGKGITLRADLLRRLQELLLKVTTGPASVVARAEAGSILSRIGDPRFRADRWWLPDEELLGFIRIEPGVFMMGSDSYSDPEATPYEQPRHRVELPEYYIARYPVTVAQFRAFVEDAGRDVGHLRFGFDNHPVVMVSFCDAAEYCGWLTDRLKGAEWTPPLLGALLAGGWVITLPSEAEWERAACGIEGSIYPWGNEFDAAKANGDETGLGTTSTVGMFPDGRSSCNALDMSGNVFEWTRSLWGRKWERPAYQWPYDPNDIRREDIHAPDSVARIARGGSFNSELGYDGYDRAASRKPLDPDEGDATIGFRLALSRVPAVASPT